MKESTPRRIAAGALFTAAVGLSVGAICAPAQADAFTSHTAFPTAVSVNAYTPHQAGGGALGFLPLSRGLYGDQYGYSSDRLRGERGDEGAWSSFNDDRGRGMRIDDERFFGEDRRGRGDDRDERRRCRPERIRPYQNDEDAIGQVIRIGDEHRGRGDRDCRHEREGWGEEGGSDFSIGFSARRIESDDEFLRIDEGDFHADHHGRDHDRRDCWHSPGRDAPRDR